MNSGLEIASEPGMLKIELSLGNRLGGDDGSRVMLLDCLSRSNFHYLPVSHDLTARSAALLTIIGLQSADVVGRHLVLVLVYSELEEGQFLYRATIETAARGSRICNKDHVRNRSPPPP